MKEILVSLDFDGVLAQALKLKKFYAKKWYNISLKNSQTKKQAFNELNLKDNFDQFIDKIIDNHQEEYIIPKGCIETLTKLKKQGFKFIITTSRIHKRNIKAKEFIKNNFSNIITKIYNTKEQPKHNILKKIKPIIHLDDDLHKLIQIENSKILLVYYRQPENKHIDIPKNHSHIKEVKNWKEFYNLCMKLK
jgi:phosphoglycolate phosphatase-like HAD superfamily hydrolase